MKSNKMIYIMTILLLGMSIILNIYQFNLRDKMNREYKVLTEEIGAKEKIIDMKNSRINKLESKIENMKQQISVTEDKSEDNVLEEIFPFEYEDIVDITFYREKEKLPMDIDIEDLKQKTLQSLYWLGDNARADIDFKELLDLEPIYIVFKLKDRTISYVYFYEKNVILMNGEAFHPGKYLYLVLNQILEPNSIIAKISRALEYKEDVENENYKSNYDSIYHFSRLEVNGKDFVQWEKELTKLNKIKSIPFYSMSEEIDFIEVYKEGIVKFDLSIVFTNDKYKTKDGITVGLTKDEVISKLGKPNSIRGNKWGYLIGDYIRFYIIFEGNKVKYLMETMPL
ncbi:hypothetical protein Y919_09715 [Caloranaerobacter azorensis H53214]|uniref:Uncharacterized protein n=1 Tax=Caloranaerobacter azorensis H53214 TaxID=1156417 RepID=A0A096BG17_9FIRM|nr:hypothetical protein [Caloranaerobacter azorensis]KGG79817.1 hypothetical protein Y919_09715 [Caloranaerobacter azorensis H53214]